MRIKSKKAIEKMLEDLVAKGLIEEGPLKNGQRTWYIPEDKVEAIEAALEDIDQL